MLDSQGKKCSTAFHYSRWKTSWHLLQGLKFKFSPYALWCWLEFKCGRHCMIVSCIHIHIVVFVLIASECSISSVNNSNSQGTQIS